MARVFNISKTKAITSELIHYVSTSADQARATKPPRPRKDLPVSVVVSDLLIAGSCDRPDAPTDVPCNNANATATAHYRCQKDLAKSLSEDSSFYVTRGGAGHFVMLDDPTTVISAVVDTFERAWRRIAAMKDGTGVVEGLGDLKLDLVEDMQDDDDELEFEEEEPEYDL
ncbi:hypothetical protein BC829DRAFT_302421 [Chytridium lagenaria]|nr:hypothetical protein BC829DRAFT_302421 [Chytridium lagenaria]